MLENIIQYFKYPIKALFYKNFYFEVLFKIRGFGLLYLLFISFIISIPTSIKVASVISDFEQREFASLLSKLPSFYIDSNGVIIPNQDDRDFIEIYSSDGNLAIVYNPTNKALDDAQLQSTIIMYSDFVQINTPTDTANVRYSELALIDFQFTPSEVSVALSNIFDLSKKISFVVLTPWFFFILVFNTLISAIFAKIIFTVFGKMKTSFGNAFRICAFANTIIGVAILVQLLVGIKIPSTVFILLPLIYVFIFVSEFRKQLQIYGVEKFVKMYAPQGTKVKNYSSENKKDLSEYTQGLNSTSNKAESTDNKNNDNNKDDSNQNNGGPGIFSA